MMKKKQKDDIITIDGIVRDTLPNDMFRVEVEGGHMVLGHASGRMRMNGIRMLPGDRVPWNYPPMILLGVELF